MKSLYPKQKKLTAPKQTGVTLLTPDPSGEIAMPDGKRYRVSCEIKDGQVVTLVPADLAAFAAQDAWAASGQICPADILAKAAQSVQPELRRAA